MWSSGKTMTLQSFLLGQPQFRVMLGSPLLEQLRQRVTAAYHLGPLSEARPEPISSIGSAGPIGRTIRSSPRIVFR